MNRNLGQRYAHEGFSLEEEPQAIEDREAPQLTGPEYSSAVAGDGPPLQFTQDRDSPLLTGSAFSSDCIGDGPESETDDAEDLDARDGPFGSRTPSLGFANWGEFGDFDTSRDLHRLFVDLKTGRYYSRREDSPDTAAVLIVSSSIKPGSRSLHCASMNAAPSILVQTVSIGAADTSPLLNLSSRCGMNTSWIKMVQTRSPTT